MSSGTGLFQGIVINKRLAKAQECEKLAAEHGAGRHREAYLAEAAGWYAAAERAGRGDLAPYQPEPINLEQED